MKWIGLSAVGIVVLIVVAWGVARHRDNGTVAHRMSRTVTRTRHTDSGSWADAKQVPKTFLVDEQQLSNEFIHEANDPRHKLTVNPKSHSFLATDNSGTVDTLTSSRAIYEDEAARERILKDMSEIFEREPIDRRWADEAQIVIDQAMEPFLSSSIEIRSVSCRASMCRLETIHDSADAYIEFMQHMLHSESCRDCFATKTAESPDGHLTMTLFMARNGHELPRADTGAEAP
ncbi:hypothetical protein [Sorangium sp. So ce388]|uniref:hypothetical protein n=1 Tax=Sorangium sp. So ce388 TaxID=3133309 RepID=UPI003F5CA69D